VRLVAERDSAGQMPALAASSLNLPALAPSIWAFVVADAASFGIFFAVFSSERSVQAAQFAQSAAKLDIRLGLFNTLVLITSSWLVAHALAAARRNNVMGARRLLAGALGVASLFAVCKAFEYSTKVSHGLTPLTNEFFSFYYVLTGVHLLHYAIGFVALLYIRNSVLADGDVDARKLNWLQSGALYWHLVDLLWVFLFPMLYLQRAL